MNWEQAKKVMESGHKVTHEDFTDEEYFHMVHGIILCENGYHMDKWFRGESWQDRGWRIKSS